jgi:hypothetical protein
MVLNSSTRSHSSNKHEQPVFLKIFHLQLYLAHSPLQKVNFQVPVALLVLVV